MRHLHTILLLGARVFAVALPQLNSPSSTLDNPSLDHALTNQTLINSVAAADHLPPVTDTTFWSTLEGNFTTAAASYRVYYKCQTSPASPLLLDVGNCVMQLDHETSSNRCRQRKDYGNFCTDMCRYRTTGFDICGVPGWGFGAPGCGDAPEIYVKMIEKCKAYTGNEWRIGGYFRVQLPGWEGTRMDMNVFHT